MRFGDDAMSARALDFYRLTGRLSDLDLRKEYSSNTLDSRATLAEKWRPVHVLEVPERDIVLTIEVVEGEPPWFIAILHRLRELLSLAENWNSYGARPIDPECVLFALEKVLPLAMRETTPPPTVVPTSRGSIMFEWHTRGIDLEVDILSPGRLHVSYEDQRTGAEWEREISSNLAPVADSLTELSGRG
jgi:hypothetical protein